MTLAPIDDDLISEIADPALEGSTWNDIAAHSVKRKAVIRAYQCRGYSLRKEPLPQDCTGETGSVSNKGKSQ